MSWSLVAELQRRRVFRALVGYGIAAFAVLQIAEPIMHAVHWPDAVLSYIVAALAIGFPRKATSGAISTIFRLEIWQRLMSTVINGSPSCSPGHIATEQWSGRSTSRIPCLEAPQPASCAASL